MVFTFLSISSSSWLLVLYKKKKKERGNIFVTIQKKKTVKDHLNCKTLLFSIFDLKGKKRNEGEKKKEDKVLPLIYIADISGLWL